MNAYSTETSVSIRELTDEELNIVNGGFLPALGAGIAIGGLLWTAYKQGYAEGSDQARRDNERARR